MREWLQGLEADDREIVSTDIKDVELAWPIGNELWEVRSNLTGGKIARLIFCVHDGLMVLLHGFIKKTQKTPKRDIDLALKRKIGRRAMKKKNIGSSFDSWMREEGTHEEVTAVAIKRVLARQVESAMSEGGLSKAEMARRMETSRSQLDRLLDPENDSVTLSTLQKAATAIGREVRLELV